MSISSMYQSSYSFVVRDTKGIKNLMFNSRKENLNLFCSTLHKNVHDFA